MTAEACQRKNTLCRFTNGDFFQTFDQQWALSQEASVSTLCQVLHRQWPDLFTITSTPRKFAECLYCAVSPLPILHVLSRSIESLVTYSLYDRSSHIHTFMHPHTDAFMYSHIHAYTTHMHIQHQFTHGCINRLESVPAVSLRFGPRSFQVESSNKRTA